MKLYAFIFITSFFLLSFNLKENRPNFKRVSNRAPISHAFILGDKSGISSSEKNDLKILGALHLLTPSGLHLSVFIGLLTFLLTLMKKEHLKLKILILFGLGLFFVPSFYSLKRNLLFSLFGLIIYDKWKIKGKGKIIFAIIFLGDFLFGSYATSPLSFIFSFLFFGTFIALGKYGYKTLFPFLFLNQILINYFFVENVYILGPFLGFFLTFIFSFLFPVALILFPVDLLTSLTPASFLFSSFLQLSHIMALFAKLGPTTIISLSTLFFAFLILYTKNWRWLLPLIIFSSQPLYNIPLSAYKKSPRYKEYKLIPEEKVIKVERTRRGFRTWHPHQIKCNATLYSYFWEKKCQLHNKTI